MDEIKKRQEEIEAIEAEIFRLYPECRFKKGKTYPIYALMEGSVRLELLKECLVDEKARKHYFTADPEPLDY